MESVYPLLQNYQIDYEWALMIGNESLEHELNAANEDCVMTAEETEATQEAIDLGVKVSDALWVMVLEDDEVILSQQPANKSAVLNVSAAHDDAAAGGVLCHDGESPPPSVFEKDHHLKDSNGGLKESKGKINRRSGIRHSGWR
jgi:hypothetical protein